MTVELDSSDGSSVDQDIVHDLQPAQMTLKRSSTTSSTTNAYQHRHSKRLSLNFPILAPTTAGGYTVTQETPQSITQQGASNVRSLSPSYRSRSPVSTQQLLPTASNACEQQKLNDSPDFLTLLASQERKVLELKEELQKAETELSTLKKQWATYEANKKRGEIRHKTVMMGPVSPKSSRVYTEDELAERDLRREARERRLRGFGIADGQTPGSGRKTGQRVFEGSHTRTLSLLQHGSGNEAASHPDEGTRSSIESNTSVLTQRDVMPSTSMPTQINNSSPLSSKFSSARQMISASPTSGSTTSIDTFNLGKTYKDLANAASRTSLPPGADVFVKQGKQMYEGVSQGFWNFVEDIRQATIGEEALNDMVGPDDRGPRRTKSQARRGEGESERVGRKGSRKALEAIENNAANKSDRDRHKKDKDVFWREFGLETPQTRKHDQAAMEANPIAITLGQAKSGCKEHESKSSTDSKSPPDLLADLLDSNEDDDAWEHWPADSPMHANRFSVAPRVLERNSIDDHDDDSGSLEVDQLQKEKMQSGLGSSNMSWAELSR